MDMPIKDEIYNDKRFIEWVKAWNNRSNLNNSNKENQFQLMKKVNPVIIPRNHKVEAALSDADKNNYETLYKLLSVIQNPYNPKVDVSEYQSPAPDIKREIPNVLWDLSYKTYGSGLALLPNTLSTEKSLISIV